MPGKPGQPFSVFDTIAQTRDLSAPRVGAYDRFDEIKDYISRFDNLFPIGGNGMHKFNNQDHSMPTAMTAVDNIVAGRADKENIWALNTEMEYHESKDGK